MSFTTFTHKMFLMSVKTQIEYTGSFIAIIGSSTKFQVPSRLILTYNSSVRLRKLLT